MPKYSRSRSTDRKRDHKHKDKKKHRRHSRSDSGKRDRKDDSRRRDDKDRRHSKEDDNGNKHRERERKENNFSQNPNMDQANNYQQTKTSNFSNQPPRQNGGSQNYHNGNHDQYQNQQNASRNDNRLDNHNMTTQQQMEEQMRREKRLSRFSDTPVVPPTQPQGFNDRGLMPPPNGVPQKRKKFVWTDANEEELRQQQLLEKRISLDQSQPALMFGGANPNLLQNLSPAILSALQDSSKIKKKIYLPKNTGVNYIGLLIGPKGLYQKRLEEESGCKILIRGVGSQKEGSAPQPDDDDDQHVLVIGDSVENVRRAQNAIERVISADDTTRNKIREEQLTVAAQINTQVMPQSQMDDSMMTPYGPPSPYAYIIPVPNDCVGLIIGKGGETIRQLQQDSGAKIQVAKKEIPNSNLRNVFVEGPPDKYQKAKELIEEIIRDQRRSNDPQISVGDINPFPGPHHKIKVPDKFVGLIIGKSGENLKGIAQRSNTKIFVPQKNNDPGAEERIIEADGDSQNVEITRQEILSLIQRYMSQNTANTFDYSKNPYGSGIAVYNQQKLASDGQQINGAVPDSLKPESGSYASSLLTENPMIAYASMQLTGWGQYEDQNQSHDAGRGQVVQDQEQAQPVATTSQVPYGQEGYDYAYYAQYGQPGQEGYDANYYNQYYQQQQFYDQNYAQTQPSYDSNNPEQQNKPAEPGTGGAQPNGDQANQYANQEYYNQYYQQQYYAGYQGAPGQQPPADYAGYYQQQQYYGQASGYGQEDANYDQSQQQQQPSSTDDNAGRPDGKPNQ